MTMLSEATESSHLHPGFAGGLSNMAWASGQVTGGLAGGALAAVTGYAVPSIAVAVLLALTAAYALRRLAPGPSAPASAG